MCIIMCIDVRIYIMYVCIIHGNFEGLIFCEGKSDSLLLLIIELNIYIIPLSHCFFLGLKFCAWQAYSEICEFYIP